MFVKALLAQAKGLLCVTMEMECYRRLLHNHEKFNRGQSTKAGQWGPQQRSCSFLSWFKLWREHSLSTFYNPLFCLTQGQRHWLLEKCIPSSTLNIQHLIVKKLLVTQTAADTLFTMLSHCFPQTSIKKNGKWPKCVEVWLVLSSPCLFWVMNCFKTSK